MKSKNFRRSFRRVLFALLIGVSLSIGVAFACSVPVFRYALERWTPDHYYLVVFSNGALPEAEQAAVDAIQERLADPQKPVNVILRMVDVSGQMDENTRAMWAALNSPELPRAALFYPIKFNRPELKTAWSGPAADLSVDTLVDSPARSEVVKRLIGGESAVWILVESGDKEKDDAAAERLEKELALAETELQPSQIDPNDPQWQYGSPLTDLQEDLKVDFSVIRVSRTDPAEAILVSMIVHSEPDLDGKLAGEPMAFPVFGQGRMLYAVIGKGIDKEPIRGACEFLVGPCSCVVKDENPGTDLLMASDWALPGQEFVSIPIPPLTGIPEMPDIAPQPGMTPAFPPSTPEGNILPQALAPEELVPETVAPKTTAPASTATEPAQTAAEPATAPAGALPQTAPAASLTSGSVTSPAMDAERTGNLLRNLVIVTVAIVVVAVLVAALTRRSKETGD